MTDASYIESVDFKALQATWSAFDWVARLRSIRADREYDRAAMLMMTSIWNELRWTARDPGACQPT